MQPATTCTRARLPLPAGGRSLVFCALLVLPGCFYVPPGDSFQNDFKTPLPAGIKVLNYYSDAYKDPCFLWVLTPVNDEWLQTVVKNAKLKPAPKDPKPASVGHGLAPWWDVETIEQIPELYSRDPDPTDGSYYRIWVDRKANRYYVLFMNT